MIIFCDISKALAPSPFSKFLKRMFCDYSQKSEHSAALKQSNDSTIIDINACMRILEKTIQDKSGKNILRWLQAYEFIVRWKEDQSLEEIREKSFYSPFKMRILGLRFGLRELIEMLEEEDWREFLSSCYFFKKITGEKGCLWQETYRDIQQQGKTKASLKKILEIVYVKMIHVIALDNELRRWHEQEYQKELNKNYFFFHIFQLVKEFFRFRSIDHEEELWLIDFAEDVIFRKAQEITYFLEMYYKEFHSNKICRDTDFKAFVHNNIMIRRELKKLLKVIDERLEEQKQAHHKIFKRDFDLLLHIKYKISS